MSDLTTLYFDESGQTGTNLLDMDQTYFSVGSTDLVEDEAQCILNEHFPRTASTDLKFRKLIRRKTHYRGLVEFARTVSRQPEHFFCYLADKRFAALAKLVDWSVEPLLSDQGFDWYRDDYGRRWVNMLYFALTQISGRAYLAEITSLYERFCDDPGPTKLAAMQARYAELGENGPNELKPFMSLIADGVSQFRQRYTFENFSDRNDIHVTCAVSSVAWWRARSEADFEVVHDQSTHFFSRRGMWDTITDMSARPGVVHIGEKSISFPLRVRTTREGNSALLVPLQICDLVAGFVARTRSDRLTVPERTLIDDMLAAGMGEIGFQSIEAGRDFVDGPPARRHGADAVDQVVYLTMHK